MLAVSTFGTPVTRVEKDDGSIAVLKGFTKEEFDTTLDSHQLLQIVVNHLLRVLQAQDNNDTPITIPPVTQPIPPTPIEPTCPAQCK